MDINYIADIRLPTERAHGYAMMKMCEELSSLGVNVKLVVPDRKNNLATDPFFYYGIKKNFHLIRLSASDFLGKTLLFGRLFYWLDLFSFTVSLLLHLDIVRCKNIYSRNYLLLIPFWWLGSNLYIELHDMPNRNFMFLAILRRCKKVFVLTKILKDDIELLGIDASKIEVLPDAVDLQKVANEIDVMEARKMAQLPIDKKIVLYWGQFYKWKGVDTMAQAAQYLDDGFCLVFVGGADLELESFKKVYGKDSKIKIVPFQKRELISAYMNAADILVLPNSQHSRISSSYTSPLKLFEYMASKRPIVASDLPSLREILNEENSVLVEPDNPKALAEGIKRVSLDHNLSMNVAARAFEDVKNYTWTKRAKKVLSTIA
ncbi:MAG: glycosyltransferase family 4 protein [Candidatus Vogelbacteria bacterium]|nr:glycosyltransferase family 4 protein [Candidatus Vogelbacteria bacterium]